MKLEIDDYAYEKLLDYIRKMSNEEPNTAEITKWLNDIVVDYRK